MGPDGTHLRVLRELAKVLNGPLPIICQQSWVSREIAADWKMANVLSIYTKGWKEDLSSYRPVSLTLVPEKVVE